jgi:hypothetical protein
MWWRSRRRRWKVQPNKKNIRKWVDALRSGEYQQGKNYLLSPDGKQRYCCLGVACEISGVGSWQVSPSDYVEMGHDPTFDAAPNHYTVPSEDGEMYYGMHYANEVLIAPVSEWLGLGEEIPRVKILTDGKEIRKDLATLNDSRGWNFHQIADAIERTYLAESA